MGFTAVAALATAGGAAAAGVAVFTAMSYVGIALSVVGAVTKDAKLIKTGGLLSVVGGVGGALTAPAGTANAAASGQAAAGEAATSSAAGEAAGATIADAGAEAAAASAKMGAPSAGIGAPSVAPVTPAVEAGNVAMQTPTVSMATPAAPAAAPAAAMPAGASESVMAVKGAAAPITPADMYPGEFMGGVVKQPANSFLSGFGKVWDGLGNQARGEVIKIGGGMLAGIGEQSRHEDVMDYRNRELALRSHGSAVPTYRRGIVNSARN